MFKLFAVVAYSDRRYAEFLGSLSLGLDRVV